MQAVPYGTHHVGDSTHDVSTKLALSQYAKICDALSCDLDCQEIKTGYAEQAVNLLRTKLGIVAKDSQMLVSRFSRGEQKQTESYAVDIATLKRDLASVQVRYHQETMVATAMKIQLDGARDSLDSMRAINDSLKRYLSTERKVGREMMAENALLRSELASYGETFGKQATMLEERQQTIEDLREKVHGLELAMKAKVADLEAAVKVERERVQAAAEERAKEMEKENASKSGISLESLMKKGGFESEKELLQFVKSRAAQEKHIERLERRVREMEDDKNEEILLRKETEKIVRQQKKEILSLEKKVAKGGKGVHDKCDESSGGTTRKRAAKAIPDDFEERENTETTKDTKKKKMAKMAKMTKKTIEVDMDGTDDVSVWNPDSARTRESQQETAARIPATEATEPTDITGIIEAGTSVHEDADKENPKNASNNGSKVSIAGDPGASQLSQLGPQKSAGTTGTKRKLLSITSQSRNSLMHGGMGRGPSMLGVTKKTGSGFSIPSLHKKP